MTKTESLDFLELPESASEEDIKSRVEEKLAYFEHLSEKSPSEFLRRLHAKNVTKVKEIAQESLDWPPYIPPVTASPIAAEPAHPLPPSSAGDGLPPPETPEEEEASCLSRFFTRFVSGILPAKKKEAEPIGWLVRHTENHSHSTLPLYPGKNYIGRKSNGRSKPFLKVDEDPYVSKIHAVILVEEKDEPQFYIYDDPSSNDGKASTNGTYINGHGERVTTKTPLLENDTVQIGITKFVLRQNKMSTEQMISEVADRAYVHTVVVAVE
jgi:hypothetical protein